MSLLGVVAWDLASLCVRLPNRVGVNWFLDRLVGFPRGGHYSGFDSFRTLGGRTQCPSRLVPVSSRHHWVVCKEVRQSVNQDIWWVALLGLMGLATRLTDLRNDNMKWGQPQRKYPQGTLPQALSGFHWEMGQDLTKIFGGYTGL